jgi:hypothetical protein
MAALLLLTACLSLTLAAPTENEAKTNVKSETKHVNLLMPEVQPKKVRFLIYTHNYCVFYLMVILSCDVFIYGIWRKMSNPQTMLLISTLKLTINGLAQLSI